MDMVPGKSTSRGARFRRFCQALLGALVAGGATAEPAEPVGAATELSFPAPETADSTKAAAAGFLLRSDGGALCRWTTVDGEAELPDGRGARRPAVYAVRRCDPQESEPSIPPPAPRRQLLLISDACVDAGTGLRTPVRQASADVRGASGARPSSCMPAGGLWRLADSYPLRTMPGLLKSESGSAPEDGGATVASSGDPVPSTPAAESWTPAEPLPLESPPAHLPEDLSGAFSALEQAWRLHFAADPPAPAYRPLVEGLPLPSLLRGRFPMSPPPLPGPARYSIGAGGYAGWDGALAIGRIDVAGARCPISSEGGRWEIRGCNRSPASIRETTARLVLFPMLPGSASEAWGLRGAARGSAAVSAAPDVPASARWLVALDALPVRVGMLSSQPWTPEAPPSRITAATTTPLLSTAESATIAVVLVILLFAGMLFLRTRRSTTHTVPPVEIATIADARSNGTRRNEIPGPPAEPPGPNLPAPAPRLEPPIAKSGPSHAWSDITPFVPAPLWSSPMTTARPHSALDDEVQPLDDDTGLALPGIHAVAPLADQDCWSDVGSSRQRPAQIAPLTGDARTPPVDGESWRTGLDTLETARPLNGSQAWPSEPAERPRGSSPRASEAPSRLPGSAPDSFGANPVGSDLVPPSAPFTWVRRRRERTAPVSGPQNEADRVTARAPRHRSQMPADGWLPLVSETDRPGPGSAGEEPAMLQESGDFQVVYRLHEADRWYEEAAVLFVVEPDEGGPELMDALVDFEMKTWRRVLAGLQSGPPYRPDAYVRASDDGSLLSLGEDSLILPDRPLVRLVRPLAASDPTRNYAGFVRPCVPWPSLVQYGHLDARALRRGLERLLALLTDDPDDEDPLHATDWARQRMDVDTLLTELNRAEQVDEARLIGALRPQHLLIYELPDSGSEREVLLLPTQWRPFHRAWRRRFAWTDKRSDGRAGADSAFVEGGVR